MFNGKAIERLQSVVGGFSSRLSSYEKTIVNNMHKIQSWQNGYLKKFEDKDKNYDKRLTDLEKKVDKIYKKLNEGKGDDLDKRITEIDKKVDTIIKEFEKNNRILSDIRNDIANSERTTINANQAALSELTKAREEIKKTQSDIESARKSIYGYVVNSKDEVITKVNRLKEYCIEEFKRTNNLEQESFRVSDTIHTKLNKFIDAEGKTAAVTVSTNYQVGNIGKEIDKINTAIKNLKK